MCRELARVFRGDFIRAMARGPIRVGTARDAEKDVYYDH